MQKGTAMIEAWLYRKVKGEILVLLLKRTEEKGGFWQPVVGRMESKDQDYKSAAIREIWEETGITEKELHTFTDNVHEFTIVKHYLTGRPIPAVHEKVVAFETTTAYCSINSNPDKEHETYKWCAYEEALTLLKWEDNKIALKKLQKMH